MMRETMVMALTMAVDLSNFLLIIIVIPEIPLIYTWLKVQPASLTLLHKVRREPGPQTAPIME